jgi:hypothetical protein
MGRPDAICACRWGHEATLSGVKNPQSPLGGVAAVEPAFSFFSFPFYFFFVVEP